MTLSETYDKMGGDYKDVIGRFYSAELIERFLKKFPDDPSYHNLCEAFAQNDVKAAFCAAHTLKGICQNLAIANLAQPLCTMTELLRAERLRKPAPCCPKCRPSMASRQRPSGNTANTRKRETGSGPFPDKEDRTDAPWRYSRRRPFFVGVCVQSGGKPRCMACEPKNGFFNKTVKLRGIHAM